MKSVKTKVKVTEEPKETASPDAEAFAIRPARDGLQPIKDLASFLETLPNFGDDAVRLREVIIEDRALRRAAAEHEDC